MLLVVRSGLDRLLVVAPLLWHTDEILSYDTWKEKHTNTAAKKGPAPFFKKS